METHEKTANNRRPSISFTVDPVTLTIASEPYVVLTARGYAPVVDVAVDGDSESRFMYISAASLSSSLEEFRQANAGKFKGIRIKVNKESSDRFAKYVIEAA